MGRGRKSAYKEEFNKQAYQLCLLGLIDEELAKTFGVSFQTLNTWKKKHPKFLESIKEGRENADSNVAKSLYKKAMGYTYYETSRKKVNGKIVETKTVKKHQPPDTAAAFIWLKNRTRHQKLPWTDSNEHIPPPGKIDKKYL